MTKRESKTEPIPHRPKQPFEDEIREAARTDATIYGALRYYDIGEWNWTMTMSALVLALNSNYQSLMNKHMDLVRRVPQPIYFPSQDSTASRKP